MRLRRETPVPSGDGGLGVSSVIIIHTGTVDVQMGRVMGGHRQLGICATTCEQERRARIRKPRRVGVCRAPNCAAGAASVIELSGDITALSASQQAENS